ncbi:MAG: GNAT family N-acetyltransferase, partial [Pseudarthrobacter sp.]
MGSEAMIIREATDEDLGTLTAAALEAMNWSGEIRFTYEQFMSRPELSHYLGGWPRAGDFGVVAVTAEGTPVGAAWCRIFAAEDAGYGFVAPDIPELTIGVLAEKGDSAFGSSQDDIVIVPYTTSMKRLQRTANVRYIMASATSPED